MAWAADRLCRLDQTDDRSTKPPAGGWLGFARSYGCLWWQGRSSIYAPRLLSRPMWPSPNDADGLAADLPAHRAAHHRAPGPRSLAERRRDVEQAVAFRAYSAGSFPNGVVHPLALDLLEKLELPTGRLRSKKLERIRAPRRTGDGFVFTVCDQAAGEVLSDLAWEPGDRSLGRAGPGRRAGWGA